MYFLLEFTFECNSERIIKISPNLAKIPQKGGVGV